jgi:hypothetical protein
MACGMDITYPDPLGAPVGSMTKPPVSAFHVSAFPVSAFPVSAFPVSAFPKARIDVLMHERGGEDGFIEFIQNQQKGGYLLCIFDCLNQFGPIGRFDRAYDRFYRKVHKYRSSYFIIFVVRDTDRTEYDAFFASSQFKQLGLHGILLSISVPSSSHVYADHASLGYDDYYMCRVEELVGPGCKLVSDDKFADRQIVRKFFDDADVTINVEHIFGCDIPYDMGVVKRWYAGD